MKDSLADCPFVRTGGIADMPLEIVHTIGATAYFVLFLLFLWAYFVPRTNPGAGWWALGMGFAFASRLALAVFPHDAAAGVGSSLYSSLNVMEKVCLVAGLVHFFRMPLRMPWLLTAAMVAEFWVLGGALQFVPAPARSLGVAAINAGFLAWAAWIVWIQHEAASPRLERAVFAITLMLVLHWASASAIIEVVPSWRSRGFLLGTALVIAQYMCLLAIVLASFQQRLLDAESRALDMAFQDPLTGLSNQRYMHVQFEHARKLAERSGQLLAVIFIDLDNFKPINDRAGHRVGDDVLKIMATRLQHATRGTDICARLGGDEFVAICTQLGHEADARGIAQKLLREFTTPVDVAGRRYPLSASIGISLYPLHGDTLEDLLEHADKAMYRAKHGGKGGYRMHGQVAAA